MQTTLRIDDKIYRKVKAKSSELGLSITRFFEEAAQERLAKLEKMQKGKISLPVSECSGSVLSAEQLRKRIEVADLDNDISGLN